MGLVVCLAGNTVIGRAGVPRERELPAEVKRASSIKFDLRQAFWSRFFGRDVGLFRLWAGGGRHRCARWR